MSKAILTLAVTFFLMFPMTGCGSDAGSAETQAQKASSGTVATMDLHKSPTCGCCEDWQQHMAEAGFATRVHHPDDLSAIKAAHDIAPDHRSCHTAVTEKGYVFEGHIPARYIKQFLNNPPPGAAGLAVPGMPIGSPGMEMGQRFDPYKILLLMKDGDSRTYAHIQHAEQQQGGSH